MQTAIYIKMYTSLPNLLFNIKACHHVYVHTHIHTHTHPTHTQTHTHTHTYVHTHTEEQKGGKEKQMGGEVGGDEKVRL